jgi:hypothetical protein
VVIAKGLLDQVKLRGFVFRRAASGEDGPLVGHRVSGDRVEGSALDVLTEVLSWEPPPCLSRLVRHYKKSVTVRQLPAASRSYRWKPQIGQQSHVWRLTLADADPGAAGIRQVSSDRGPQLAHHSEHPTLQRAPGSCVVSARAEKDH